MTAPVLTLPAGGESAIMTRDDLLTALRNVLGRRFDEGVVTDQPGSSLVLEHDKACMRAFFDEMTGHDVEVIRVLGKQLWDTGRYPWADGDRS